MPDQFEGLQDEQNVSVPGEEIAEDKNLLDMKESDAAKRMMDDWDKSHKPIRNFMEQSKANKAREQGYTGVQIIKLQDDHKLYIPLGATPSAVGMNKAARLKRRVKTVLFSDPPLPDATAFSDSDEDRADAEFSTRALIDLGSENQLDFAGTAAEAFDRAGTYGSGFRRYWIDEQGGGRKPVEVLAAPGAQTLDAALVDPATGLQWEGDLVTKYLREDGSLTDDRKDEKVRRKWLPKMRVEVLTMKHVRFIPPTARDIWDADGVMIGAVVPLGTLKQMFPKLEELDDDKLEEIVKSRPQKMKDLLPAGMRHIDERTVKNETLVFVLTRYHRQGGEYEKGAYLIAAGNDVILHRGEWYDDEHDQPLDIPVDQIKQLDEEDNPYGKGILELLGPAQEIRAAMIGTMLEYLDRFRNRKVFVPITSMLQAAQLQSPTATAIPINPGGEPKYEELPDFPRIVEKMFDFTTTDMDDESSLQQTAQGLAPPSIKSGKHAQQVVQQSLIGLSDLKQNAERGMIRGWRIMLQLARWGYTTAQRLSWVGADGIYKEKDWTGADLGSTRDVRIQRGSFTGLSPDMKAALAERYAETGVVDPQTLKRIVLGQVSSLIGLQDDPHLMRVRRQIDRWEQGPPEGWQPQVDEQGQPLMDEQDNPVPDPTLSQLFQPLAVDEEPMGPVSPGVAGLRAFELGRALASTKYAKWPPEWQQGIEAEYVRMRQAAGIQTIAEQQQAAQQASEQEGQAAQGDAQAKVQEAEIRGRSEVEKTKIAADAGVREAELQAQSREGVVRTREPASI